MDLRALADRNWPVLTTHAAGHTAEYASPDGHVLMFAATVTGSDGTGGRDIQGVDVIRDDPADPDAPLRELTVMVRPYSAATVLRKRMAALLTG
jgi:hypothetical protein